MKLFAKKFKELIRANFEKIVIRHEVKYSLKHLNANIFLIFQMQILEFSSNANTVEKYF